MRPRFFHTLFLTLLTLVLAVGCGGASAPVAPPQEPQVLEIAAPEGAPNGDSAPGARGATLAIAADPDPGLSVPVTRGDPQLGDPLAPVTLVVWSDFQCPFCDRMMTTLDQLAKIYGPRKLRIVWKDNPLPFHKAARPAALAAETVFQLGGDAAFFRFADLAFENQRDLTDENFVLWAGQVGVDVARFRREYEGRTFEASIDGDLAKGKEVGVTGTPASFVNGVFMSGAQPAEKFQEVIDEMLVEANLAIERGLAPSMVYATLSAEHFAAPKPKEPVKERPEDDDKTVWLVPIDGSPAQGGKQPLVTLVMFSEFQCPFCSRVKPTIADLLQKYGGDLRVVWKNQPLPFHKQAKPAAEMAMEAFAQKGDAGFWAAYSVLFDNQQHLEDADLLGYAKDLGLSVARVKAAIENEKHKKAIEADQSLADDVEARGTPHFFINGRRLAGAQLLERFTGLIDEEIVHAKALLAKGTKRASLYAVMQKGAQSGPRAERIVMPSDGSQSPAKGASRGAKVVVQMFSDHQCPFCKRGNETVDELIAAYPGKVRVVWRHLPLPFHKQAEISAEAAMEAQAQKGDAGFWKMTERLFEAQATGLDAAAIESAAVAVGLDMARFRLALERHTHLAVVQADAKMAESLGVTGTPSFAVNDYFVSGAQPLSKFKKLVEKALGPADPIAPGDEVKRVNAAAVAKAPAATPPAVSGEFGAKHILIQYQGAQRAPFHITRSKTEALAMAKQVLVRAKAGEAFGDLAAIYSDEPGAATRGGDLGTFKAGMMVPEFQSGVEALKPGEVGGPVETSFGYHIILRTQ